MALRRLPRALVIFLQVSVSAGLLAWLLSRADFRASLTAVLRSADPTWLAAGLGLAGAVHLLCLVRWRIFLLMVGVRVGWGESAGLFFAGLFSGLFLPGGAGGDLVKIGLLAARGHDAGRSALSVVMDRLAGSVTMIIVGVTLLATQYRWLAASPVTAGLVQSIGIYLLVLTVLISTSVALSYDKLVARLPDRWPGRAKVLELSGAYFQCARQWPRTLQALGVSLVMLVLFFLSYYCAARACGVDPGVLRFLAIMPTVDILAGLPVSFGGLGVREGVFVLLLGTLVGVPAATAVAISLTGYTLSAVWGLPGAFLWLIRRPTP